jgi:hypothetical protein
MGSPAEVISALWNHSVQMEETGESDWPTFGAQEVADIAAFMQRSVEE